MLILFIYIEKCIETGTRNLLIQIQILFYLKNYLLTFGGETFHFFKLTCIKLVLKYNQVYTDRSRVRDILSSMD